MKRSSCSFFFALIMGSVGGCQSAHYSDRYVELSKDVIELEHVAAEKPSNASSQLVKSSKYHRVDFYPSWVVSPDKAFDVAVGVNCRDLIEPGYDFELTNKRLARDSAMLNLFQLTESTQKVHAKETLDNSVQEYSSVIKVMSYGKIGANKIAREGFYEISGVKSYCVAVAFST